MGFGNCDAQTASKREQAGVGIIWKEAKAPLWFARKMERKNNNSGLLPWDVVEANAL